MPGTKLLPRSYQAEVFFLFLWFFFLSFGKGYLTLGSQASGAVATGIMRYSGTNGGVATVGMDKVKLSGLPWSASQWEHGLRAGLGEPVFKVHQSWHALRSLALEASTLGEVL
jgi:hypothetical protein